MTGAKTMSSSSAANFAQPNVMGAEVKGGYGGGIPVVAFWTGRSAKPVGHVETLPLTLSLPVKVDARWG